MKNELRTEFQTVLDKRAVLLETYVESRVNEVHKETNSTLEQFKEIVAVVRESQERMWRAIDGMSKEVQELFKGTLALRMTKKQSLRQHLHIRLRKNQLQQVHPP